jgi:5-methylcytosine-specific restriction endonuclease McrA
LSPHKKIYCKAFGLNSGDYIGCSICPSPAVDVHAIIADGMGGRPNKDTHRIENLIALCRDCHVRYGDKKEHKASLFRIHKAKMYDKGIKFDSEWIDEQILKHG